MESKCTIVALLLPLTPAKLEDAHQHNDNEQRQLKDIKAIELGAQGCGLLNKIGTVIRNYFPEFCSELVSEEHAVQDHHRHQCHLDLEPGLLPPDALHEEEHGQSGDNDDDSSYSDKFTIARHERKQSQRPVIAVVGKLPKEFKREIVDKRGACHDRDARDVQGKKDAEKDLCSHDALAFRFRDVLSVWCFSICKNNLLVVFIRETKPFGSKKQRISSIFYRFISKREELDE